MNIDNGQQFIITPAVAEVIRLVARFS